MRDKYIIDMAINNDPPTIMVGGVFVLDIKSGRIIYNKSNATYTLHYEINGVYYDY